VAISIRGNAGAWAASTDTTQTVTLPTHATGDMLIVRAACKPYTASITCGTTGWNAVGTGYANGSTADGNGVGSVMHRAFYKVATSASETNPVVTWGATSDPGMACAVVYQLGAGEGWETPTGAGGGDATLRTSQTCTISSHISTTAGDMVDFFLAWGDNYASTSPTFTQASASFGTVAEQPAAAGSFSDGFDGAADGGYRLCSSGTSSAAAVVTATFGNSEQGGAWTTRLRVFPAKSVSPGVASGTGTAYGPPIKYALAGHAAATATALAPTVTHVEWTWGDWSSTFSNPTSADVNVNAGHASGAGAAYAPVPAVFAAAGNAAATGSAYQPTISTGKSVDAGLAAATGTAYSPPIKFALVGLASGVGAANAPPAKVAPNAAHASGTGSAYQPVANPKPNAGVAAATGSAYGPPIKYVPAGLASGTGAAYAPTLTCASNAVAGHASGTGAAYGPPIKYVLAGHAAATGAAYAPTLTCASNASAGHASGAGAAYAPTLTCASNAVAGHASGTGAAYDASETVAPNAGLAAGTGDAYEPTVETGGAPATSVYPDCASGTGDAYAASTKVNVNVEGGATGTGAAYGPPIKYVLAGHAAGTGAAYAPTLTCTSNASAGHASGTGAAYNPPFGAPAGHASGTGSAYQPTLTILSNAPAGHAAGTGAAFGASETVAPNAGTAAATGAAYGPPIKYVPAGLASGTGAAYAPTLTCASNAPAGHAAATGAAYEPTVETGGTFAPAGCAEGTGAAYDPTVTASPSVYAWCDAATGTGAAYGATLPTISGVTRDENGAAIPLCTVDAFVSSTNAYYATTTSDATGRYSIIVAPGVYYFLVAYDLVGDVYGVTARDLSA